ncbi:MAG: hypothetical protein JWM56_1104 [Candidatus Peribacteria bacterium]|nr:hypothetical protein [Candidatus Peribacteria bacterium]
MSSIHSAEKDLILDPEDVVGVLAEQAPGIIDKIHNRVRFWREKVGAVMDPHLELSAKAAPVFIANMANRYGYTRNISPEKLDSIGLYLAYHRGEHPVDMRNRFEKVIEAFSEEFTVVRSTRVTNSIGGHDLRQREAGIRTDGVGLNEYASAEETVQILIEVGMDPEDEQEKSYLDAVSRDIRGTTFNPMKTDESRRLGALAPDLIPEILEKYLAADTAKAATAELQPVLRKLDEDLRSGARDDQPTLLVLRSVLQKYLAGENGKKAMEEIEDMLLVADCDVGSVAEGLEKFVLSGMDLWREITEKQGKTLNDVPAQVTLGFLTNGQKGFFGMHRFQTEKMAAVFAAGKAKVAAQLPVLVERITAEFSANMSSEDVMKRFLELAIEIESAS